MTDANTAILVVVAAMGLVLLASIGCVLVALWVSQKGDRQTAKHVARYEELAKQFTVASAQTAGYALDMATSSLRDTYGALAKAMESMGRPAPPVRVPDADWTKFNEGDRDEIEAEQERSWHADRDEGAGVEDDFDLDDALGGDTDPGIAAARAAAARAGTGTTGGLAAGQDGEQFLRAFIARAGLDRPPRGMAGGAGPGGRPDAGAGGNGDERRRPAPGRPVRGPGV